MEENGRHWETIGEKGTTTGYGNLPKRTGSFDLELSYLTFLP